MASTYLYSKVSHILGWLILSATVIHYIISGTPINRGIWFFITIAIATVIATVDILRIHSLKSWQFLSGSSLILVAGFILRWTALDQMALVTGDQRAFLTYTATIIEEGVSGIPGGYAFSPLLMIEQAIIHFITGETIIRSIVGATAISALIPLLVGAVLYTETSNRQLCFIGILLATPFVLFLRRSALVRPELIVLVWFGTVVLLLMITLSKSDKRARLVLILLVGTIILVHPFYSVVFTIIFGTAAVISLSITRLKPDRIIVNSQGLVILSLLVGSLAVLRALWTPTSSYAILIMTNIEIPSVTNIITNFISPPDSIGRDLGDNGNGGGGGKPFIRVIRFGQIVMLLGLAGVSILFTIVKYRAEWAHLLIISGAMLFLGVLATVGSFHSNVGFRTYYFVGIALLLLGSIAIAHIFVYDTAEILLTKYSIPITRNILLLVLAVYVFVFWVVGPISALGNGVDPIPYGERLAWSHAEYDQWIRIADRLLNDYNPYTPSVDSMSMERSIDSSTCEPENSSKVWDSGDIFLCKGSNQ